MKKHHATILVIAGILAVLLATTLTLDADEGDIDGYVIDEKPHIDALACCTIEGKTCYSLDGSCAVCDAVC